MSNKIIDRLDAIYKDHLDYRLPLSRKRVETIKFDSSKPYNSMASLGDELRFVAISEYHLHRDFEKLRENMRESVDCSIRLFKWHNENVDSVDESYVSMLAMTNILDAMVIESWAQAEELSGLIGGRTEIEKKNDHPFTNALGYAVKYFVLKDIDNMPVVAKKLSVQCAKKKNKSWSGYAEVFNGVLVNDIAMVDSGFERVVKGHKMLSRPANSFGGTIDETMCIWGLGLANMCRHYYQLPVKAFPPMIPADLLTQDM